MIQTAIIALITCEGIFKIDFQTLERQNNIIALKQK